MLRALTPLGGQCAKVLNRELGQVVVAGVFHVTHCDYLEFALNT
jgi:hypothetical protein